MLTSIHSELKCWTRCAVTCSLHHFALNFFEESHKVDFLHLCSMSIPETCWTAYKRNGSAWGGGPRVTVSASTWPAPENGLTLERRYSPQQRPPQMALQRQCGWPSVRMPSHYWTTPPWCLLAGEEIRLLQSSWAWEHWRPRMIPVLQCMQEKCKVMSQCHLFFLRQSQGMQGLFQGSSWQLPCSWASACPFSSLMSKVSTAASQPSLPQCMRE